MIPTDAGDAVLSDCRICSGSDMRRLQIVVKKESGRTRGAEQCGRCGFIAFGEAVDGFANTKAGPRLGTPEQAGRDFAIVDLAAQILGRDRLQVLLWEPGRTGDVERIEALDSIKQVTAAVQPSSEFPDAGVQRLDPALASSRFFDIAVGNEIAQSFAHPKEQLSSMLRSVRDDGVVVLSTDLYDGTDLNGLSFPRNYAHRWFWTGSALAEVARLEGHRVDVRIPKLAVRKKFWRKRYVFFSQSDDVMRNIRNHFGAVLHAPSEAS